MRDIKKHFVTFPRGSQAPEKTSCHDTKKAEAGDVPWVDVQGHEIDPEIVQEAEGLFETVSDMTSWHPSPKANFVMGYAAGVNSDGDDVGYAMGYAAGVNSERQHWEALNKVHSDQVDLLLNKIVEMAEGKK